MHTAFRRFPKHVIPAALLIFLAGCSTTPVSDVPGPARGGASPVTVAHKYGATTLNHPPKRIVTLGYTDQDAVLALGVVPVATTKWLVSDYPGAVGPWARHALGSAQPPAVLSDRDGLPFERIAAQKPDLILGLYSGMTKQDYERLSSLAPTIAQPAHHADYGIPWQDSTRTVGTALGRSDEAERLVREVEDRFAVARRENPKFSESTAALATTYGGYFVYGSQDPRSRVLNELAFHPPRDLDQVVGQQFGVNISRERTDLLDTDALIWFTPHAQTTPRSDPIYAGMRVAREGRDIFIDEADDYGNAFAFSSVLSLPYVLDRLVPQLRDATDGRPTPPR